MIESIFTTRQNGAAATGGLTAAPSEVEGNGHAWKTVLVTGGAGFVGSNFVRHLLSRYPAVRVIVLDAFTYAGNVENLPAVSVAGEWGDRLAVWHGNVRNAGLVESLVSQADVVVHFAAETHVTRSIFDNFGFFETDVLGTQVVANAVLKHRARIERFVHISTSEVYGTAVTERMAEDHSLDPMSPYAAAKTGADRLIYSYWATYRIPVTILRPFNIYGPYQHLEKAVPRFITSCLLDEPLTVHGDGGARRDWNLVDDVCDAVDRVLRAPRDLVEGQVFNVGSGRDMDIQTLAETIVDRMGRPRSQIHHVLDRPGQVFRHTADASKIRRVLGWIPGVNLEEGLDRTIRWYSENRSWWQKMVWMRSVPLKSPDGQVVYH